MNNLRFGIEIETVGKNRRTVANAIQSVVGGTVTHVGSPACYDPYHVDDSRGRTWKVVSDASLSNVPGNLRAEVVSPVLNYSDLKELQNIVRAIRKAGAKVDEKCGMHIHVDAAPFTGKTLANLVKIVYKQEALIHVALQISQSRLNSYTKPISSSLVAKIEQQKPQTLDQMNEIWYGFRYTNPTHYHESRYHGVNLHNVWYRGTVEFRWFAATLHAGRVKAAIQFVLAIANKALNSRYACSKRREHVPSSAKYDFRVFLLNLGLIGNEFKTARLHLLSNLTGSAAWKNG